MIVPANVTIYEGGSDYAINEVNWKGYIMVMAWQRPAISGSISWLWFFIATISSHVLSVVLQHRLDFFTFASNHFIELKNLFTRFKKTAEIPSMIKYQTNLVKKKQEIKKKPHERHWIQPIHVLKPADLYLQRNNTVFTNKRKCFVCCLLTKQS